jgi:DNA (cytosine-5)-methyltransferase 1
MCHPIELRALTVGEMAAVQEFPKDWKFVGSPTDKCRQIGNAVPIRLGIVAGKVVCDLLAEVERKDLDNVSPGQRTMTHIRPHVRTRTFFKGGQVYAGNHSYYQEDTNQLTLFDAL